MDLGIFLVAWWAGEVAVCFFTPPFSSLTPNQAVVLRAQPSTFKHEPITTHVRLPPKPIHRVSAHQIWIWVHPCFVSVTLLNYKDYFKETKHGQQDEIDGSAILDTERNLLGYLRRLQYISTGFIVRLANCIRWCCTSAPFKMMRGICYLLHFYVPII